MKPFISVRGERERREAGGGDIDPDLFLQFPDQGLFRRFSGIEFATRKFPQASHFFPLRAAREQDPPVNIHQGAGGDQQQGFGAGFRHFHLGAAKNIVPCRLKQSGRHVAAAGGEVLEPGTGLAEARVAQHGGRGGIVVRHRGGDAVHVQVGERPTRQA